MYSISSSAGSQQSPITRHKQQQQQQPTVTSKTPTRTARESIFPPDTLQSVFGRDCSSPASLPPAPLPCNSRPLAPVPAPRRQNLTAPTRPGSEPPPPPPPPPPAAEGRDRKVQSSPPDVPPPLAPRRPPNPVMTTQQSAASPRTSHRTAALPQPTHLANDVDLLNQYVPIPASSGRSKNRPTDSPYCDAL